MARARSGEMWRALKRPRPGFTSTVVSLSPSSAFASRQTARSPVTISTGQPQVPQSAAPTLFETFMAEWQEAVLGQVLPGRLIPLCMQQTGLATALLEEPG